MTAVRSRDVFHVLSRDFDHVSCICRAQATGAISRAIREAQANLAASANLLVLVLLAAAAARRHSRPVPAQRSKDRHAPTPHLQRASLPLYLNSFNKSYSIVFETFSDSRAHTRVHSTRHPQPFLQIAVKIRARNTFIRF